MSERLYTGSCQCGAVRSVFPLILLLGLVIPASHATPMNEMKLPFGLENLNWRMTERSAKRILPRLSRSNETGGIEDSETDSFGIEHYPIDGCDFSLSLEFYNGALNAVGLAGEHNIRACEDAIRKELRTRFGRGQESYVADLEVYNIDWHTPNGAIRYQINGGYNPRFKEKHLYLSFWRPNAYFRPIP